MAFTPPALRSLDDMITGSDWNTSIKANFEAGVPGLFTTKGDLAVGVGSQEAARLAVGSNGQWLQADTGYTNLVGWDNFHRAKVQRNSQVVVPNATFTYITFDAEVYDNGGLAVPGSQVMTIQNDGIYKITGFIRLSRNGVVINPSETVQGSILLNGGVFAYIGYIQPAAETLSAFGYLMLKGSVITHALAGWTFGLSVYQTTGGTMVIDPSQAWLEIEAA